MKRLAAAILSLPVVIAPVAVAAPAAAHSASARSADYPESLCQERPYMCLDKYRSIGPNGEYTGHDEPTVQFSSHRPGSGGRELTYDVTLPKDAAVKPNQAGTGGTWDFQRRATFWLSITMCDTSPRRTS